MAASIVIVLLLASEAWCQRETLPITFQPRPLTGDCPASRETIADIHDGIQAVLQEKVEPARRELLGLGEPVSEISQLKDMLQNTTDHLSQQISALRDDFHRLSADVMQLDVQIIAITSCTGNVTAGRWTRVAYLDMTDPAHQCPREWKEIPSPVRTCGRGANTSGCDSVVFSTDGTQYSSIFGRVIGYQFGDPNAFSSYTETIDSYYLDGVSVTRGTPREHIWSFTAEWQDNRWCPCSSSEDRSAPPSFVGEDYFCESGTVNYYEQQRVFYDNDPLWDGQGCRNNTCCLHNTPPWFCKQLLQATTDDIEVRICSDEDNTREDTPIELIEIYVR